MVDTQNPGEAVTYTPIVLPTFTGITPQEISQFRQVLARQVQGEFVDINIDKEAHVPMLYAWDVLHKESAELLVETAHGRKFLLSSTSVRPLFRPPHIEQDLYALLETYIQNGPTRQNTANPTLLMHIDLSESYGSIAESGEDILRDARNMLEVLDPQILPVHTIELRGSVPTLLALVALSLAATRATRVYYRDETGKHLLFVAAART